MTIENVDLNKSANQLWRESNTSLSFADWLTREKQKPDVFIPNKVIDDALQTIRKITNVDTEGKTEAEINKDKIFGLNKYIIFSAIVIISGAFAYNFYQKRK